jgi:hypothetical protein
MVCRVTEQQFTRLGTLEVQVRRVFPRETDTTVNLDVLGCSVEICL